MYKQSLHNIDNMPTNNIPAVQEIGNAERKAIHVLYSINGVIKKMNTKLFVANLSPDTIEEDLRWLFSKTGNVVSVNLIKDKETGKSKGFAFVEMISVGDAGKAVSEFNGYELNKRQMKVSPAKVNAKPQRNQKPGFVEYESYNKSIRK